MQQTQKGRQQIMNSAKKGGEVSHWSKYQQLAFIWFLLVNLQDIYQKDSNRVKKRLFTLMSEFIPTRKPTQCRTHFSRLIKQKQQHRDVKVYLGKKLFQCFCCQKNPSKAIALSIEQYLKTQNIQNPIFFQNLQYLNSNIQEVYQVGKQQKRQFHHLNYEHLEIKQREPTTNQTYLIKQNENIEIKDQKQRKYSELFDFDIESLHMYNRLKQDQIDFEGHSFNYEPIFQEC